MHYLYILHSKTVDKYYVGETYDVHQRIKMHNAHLYNGSFTKIAHDWELVLSFPCKDEAQAVYLEKFIKRMKSKNFLKRIINQPDVLGDILSKR